MKKVPLLVLLCLLVGSLGWPLLAREPNPAVFESFVRYDRPWDTGLAVPPQQLQRLQEIFALMASSDFTFIYRQDTDHWAGLYRHGLLMTLHIHNTDANFDFRARIDRQSGAIILLRGVGYRGLDKQQSGRLVSRQAISYLDGLLATPDIFRKSPQTAKSPNGKELPLKALADRALPVPLGEPPNDPLTRLIVGNQRFAKGASRQPHQDELRRQDVAKAQHPFAIIVSCSDSRVSPEILFDQGLGDLFVIRTAGEVVGDLELGSIEYAVEHLQVRHIMVLGHERCGAVDATIQGEELPENILRIAMKIRPAVRAARGLPGELLDNAIRQHALNVRESIRASEIVAELIAEQQLSLSAAYYDLDTGRVSLLD